MYLKVKLSTGGMVRYNRDEAMSKYWLLRMELDKAIREKDAHWAITLKAMLKTFEHYFERRSQMHVLDDPSLIERRKQRVKRVGHDDGLEPTKVWRRERKQYNGTTTVRRTNGIKDLS